MRKIAFIALLSCTTINLFAQTLRSLNGGAIKKSIKLANIQNPDLTAYVLKHSSKYIISQNDSVELFVYSALKAQTVGVKSSITGSSISAKEINKNVTLAPISTVLQTSGISVSSVGGKHSLSIDKTSNINSARAEKILKALTELGLTKTLDSKYKTSYAEFVTVPFTAVSTGVSTVSFTCASNDAVATTSDAVTVDSAPFTVSSTLAYDTVLLTQSNTLSYICDISNWTNQSLTLRLSSLTDGTSAFLQKGNDLIAVTSLSAIPLDASSLASNIVFRTSKLGDVNYSFIFKNMQGKEITVSGGYGTSASNYVVYGTAVEPSYLAIEDKVIGKTIDYPFNETAYNLTYYSNNNENQLFKLTKISFSSRSSEKDYVRFGGTSNANKQYGFSSTDIYISKDIAIPSNMYWYCENLGENTIYLTFANQDGNEAKLTLTAYRVSSKAVISLTSDLGNTVVLGNGTANKPKITIAVSDPNPNSTFVASVSSDKLFSAVDAFNYPSKTKFEYWASGYEDDPGSNITNDGVHNISVGMLRNDGSTFSTTLPIQFNFLSYKIYAVSVNGVTGNNTVNLYSGDKVKMRISLYQGENTTYSYAVAFVNRTNYNINPFYIKNFSVLSPNDYVSGNIDLKSISGATKIDKNTYEFEIVGDNGTTIVQSAKFDFVFYSLLDKSDNFNITNINKSSFPTISSLKPPIITVTPIKAVYEDGYPFLLSSNVYSNNSITIHYKLSVVITGQKYMYRIVSDNEGVVSSTVWAELSSPSADKLIYLPTKQGCVGVANLNIQACVMGRENDFTLSRKAVTVIDDVFDLNLSLYQLYKGVSNVRLASSLAQNTTSYKENACHNQLSIKLSVSTAFRSKTPVNGNIKILKITSSSGDIFQPNDVFGSLLSKDALLKTISFILHKGKTTDGWVEVTAVNGNGYVCTERINYLGLRNPTLPVFSFIGNAPIELLEADINSPWTEIYDFYLNENDWIKLRGSVPFGFGFNNNLNGFEWSGSLFTNRSIYSYSYSYGRYNNTLYMSMQNIQHGIKYSKSTTSIKIRSGLTNCYLKNGNSDEVSFTTTKASNSISGINFNSNSNVLYINCSSNGMEKLPTNSSSKIVKQKTNRYIDTCPLIMAKTASGGYAWIPQWSSDQGWSQWAFIMGDSSWRVVNLQSFIDEWNVNGKIMYEIDIENSTGKVSDVNFVYKWE